ncbi:MAG: anaerobic ribonucleoside-triphosphate reductase activating protein [Spartobacteria bacterium]|nr:anaerobic ribonucleoside-triphosphate reductase activating protein [Spartobacteria bacterium]
MAEFSYVYGMLKQPSLVDFPGHYASVLFTSGCNFRCGYCHNAELIETRKGLTWTRLSEMCREQAEQWVDAAVITGGEPTLHPSLEELIAFLRAFGWAIKLDTNGSRPDVLARVLPLVDFVAMDVKADLAHYAEWTGFTRMDAVQRSIDLIKKGDTPYEFRTTVVASFHDEQQMAQIGKMIQGARQYYLQPFVPRDTLPNEALRQEPRTPDGVMQQYKTLMTSYVQEVTVRG